jgi:hypothetical protein
MSKGGAAGSNSVSWTPSGLKPGNYVLSTSLADGSVATCKFAVQGPAKSKH